MGFFFKPRRDTISAAAENGTNSDDGYSHIGSLVSEAFSQLWEVNTASGLLWHDGK